MPAHASLAPLPKPPRRRSLRRRNRRKSKNMPLQAKQAIGALKIKKARLAKWLKNPQMREIATLIYLFNRLVPEGESRNKAIAELSSFYTEASAKLANIPANNPAKAGIGFIQDLTKGFSLG